MQFLHSSVLEYLKQYGFEDKNVIFDFKITDKNTRMIVDATIILDNHIFAVVEIKNGAEINNVNKNSLISSPFIRQLQTYSIKLDAPYYIFTNGLDFIWFQTNNDGRPEIIEPINNTSTNKNDNYIFSMDEAILSCQNVLRRDGASINLSHELLLIIISHVCLADNINNINRILSINLHSELEKLQKSTRDECYKILSLCNWRNIKNNDFLFALDLIFTKNNYMHNYKIPLWLADLMIRISSVFDNSTIYDPHANLGEIQTVLSINKKNSDAIYRYNSIDGALFVVLTKLLLHQDLSDINYLPEHESLIMKDYFRNPDRIITALPFGVKTGHINYDLPIKLSNLSDQILLSSILNMKDGGILTALVPENFLFGGGQKKQLREYILNSFTLSHIISLPSGLLSPYSNVKSSIIVIEKKKQVGSYDVLISILKDFKINLKILDCKEIPAIKTLLESILSRSTNNENTLKVRADELRDAIIPEVIFDNMTTSNTDYPLISLKEVCKKIVKGKNIKLDENGDVPVIGPGAIRSFVIDPMQFNKTLKDNVDERSINVNPGDILINSISTFLGSSAMVKSEFEGFVSQHAIVVKPDPKKINPEYLEIALNSKYVQRKMQMIVSGSVIPSLNVTKVRELLIPIPSLDVQQKLIKQVKSILSDINDLKTKLSQKEETFNKVINDLGSEEDYS